MRRSAEQREDDRLLLDSARGFLNGRRAWPRRPSEGDWGDYAEIGWTVMGLPTDLGGFDTDIDQGLLLLEEAGRAMLAESLVATLTTLPALARHLAPEMLLVTGGVIDPTQRFALVLPENGADALTGSMSEGQLVLDGKSGLAPGLGDATDVVVVARQAGGQAGDRIVAFVPRDVFAAGEISSAVMFDGRSAGRLACSGTRIPAQAVVAKGERGGSIAAEATDASILGLCAECLGALQRGLDVTVDYVRTRRQFGQPLGNFQAVQHKLAEAYCEIAKLRSLIVVATASMRSELAGPRDEIAALKIFLGRNALAAASTLIQVSGGIAMTEDYIVGHAYKRLQVAASLFGTTEQHLAAFE